MKSLCLDSAQITGVTMALGDNQGQDHFEGPFGRLANVLHANVLRANGPRQSETQVRLEKDHQLREKSTAPSPALADALVGLRH